MTVLIAGLCLTLTVSFSWFSASVGELVSRRARAQYAADAAALAAAGAMVPGAPGDPETEAHRYAAANGAELLSCTCEPAAQAAKVKVSIGDATAEARAELDMTRIAPRSLGISTGGLHPVMKSAVDRLLAAGGGSIVLNSGWRSTERQTELWQDALRRHGTAERADDWVARPGSSMHERGLAVDLGGDVELASRLVGSLGLPLHRPLPHEPWHFELVGAR